MGFLAKTRKDEQGMLKRRCAFTLIELMVTSALLAMVGMAIVSTFASGLKVYYRLRDSVGARADILIALERVERDLKNSFNTVEIPFHGEAKRIAFPVILERIGDSGSSGSYLGRVTYYYDDYKKTLSKKEEDYARVVSETGARDKDIKELASVNGVEFSYYYYDKRIQSYEWKSTWIDELEGRRKDEKRNAGINKGTLSAGAGKSPATANNASQLGSAPLTPKDGTLAGKQAASKEEMGVDSEFNPPLGVKIKINYKDGANDAVMTRMMLLPLSVSRHIAELRAEAKKGTEKAK